MLRRLIPAALLASALLVACAEEDKTAPPAPFLDPVESPTGLTKITLTGSAEYGSTVRVSGGASDVQTTADQFTARFRVEVDLKADATNTLQVTATDAAGNTSEPAKVEIAQQTGYGDLQEVTLDLFRNDETTPLTDPVLITAGDTLKVQAVARDAAGNALATPVTVNTNIPGALLEGVTLTELSKAGEFKVVATVAGSPVFATRKVTIQPGPPASVAVSFSKEVASAGEIVPFRADAVDSFGNPIPDAALELSVEPALAATFTIPGSSPAITKEQGILTGTRTFVAYDLSGVAASGGVFTLKATAQGTALEGTASLKVQPASGASFSKLEFADGTQAVTVAAGQDVSYAYQVVDLYGNPTATPVSVFTSAPGAVVLDDGVSGAGQIINLRAAGTYPVAFYIAGAGQKGNLQVSVGNGPPAFVDVAASSTLVSPNTDVKVFAQVRDAYGNPIDCTTANSADVAFTAAGQSTGAVAAQSTGCFNTAFEATYRFAAEDNYVLTASYAPGGTPSGVSDSVYVTVFSFDNTPPTLAVLGLQHDGVPCPAAPAVCTVRPGEQIQFSVEANDNKSLSEVSYTAFFSTAGVSGTLRSQRVLVPSDATLPFTQPFSFVVPNAFIEDVPLTAMAIDGAGNRTNSPAYLLRVTLQTFAGRTVQLVYRDTAGNVLNNPEDVALAPNGDLFIANEGNSNVLSLSSGALFPQVYASQASLNGASPRFIARDVNGKLYVTDSNGSSNALQITPGSPATTVSYVDYTSGPNLRGLAMLGKSTAKGVAVIAGSLDGDSLTIGARTYELNSVGSCNNAAHVCLSVAVGASNATIANLLSDCINSGSGCTINGSPASADPAVTSTVSTSPNVAVIVAAKTAGAAGAVAFTTTACPRIQLNGAGNTCPAPTTTLQNGFDESLAIGQENGGGAASDVIDRFPLNFTAPFPKTEANALAGYDMTVSGIPHEQFGLAARDLFDATARSFSDYAYYFSDATLGINRLRGARYVDNGPATAIFNSAAVANGRNGCADCIRGTNDPSTPSVNFSFLWDLTLEPSSGCLLVSDAGNGDLYAVDTRNPTTADPLVTLVATGLNSPRGMDFGADGRLYVAVRNANAIIALSPSADPNDCF